MPDGLSVAARIRLKFDANSEYQQHLQPWRHQVLLKTGPICNRSAIKFIDLLVKTGSGCHYGRAISAAVS